MKHLVLLHGWGASERIWRRQVEAFGSEFAALTPRIPRWDAAWLAQYFSGIDLRESVLVGWSLGGMLLLEALAGLGNLLIRAEKKLLPPHPNPLPHWGRGDKEGNPLPHPLITPLATVLVGVPAVFCRQPDHPWGQAVATVRAMRQTLRSDPRRVINDFARACLAPGEESYRQEVAAGFDFAAAPAYLAQGLDYLRDTDLRSLLPRFPGKIAIIQGEKDGIVPPAQAQFLQEHLPNSRLHLLPGAGHLPFLTQAQKFNSLLRDLLGT